MSVASSTPSRTAPPTSAWIGRPIQALRVAVGLLVALILAGLVVTLAALRAPALPLTLGELVQAIEAGVNDLVFVAIAVFFLLTLETRLKRRRALQAIHELRSIAHVIDMHQLTDRSGCSTAGGRPACCPRAR